MRIIQKFDSQNMRRYSRPWIAKITAWPIGGHPKLEFGVTISNVLCEIDAKPGDVIRYGQRDNRGNNTINEYAIVHEDGTLEDVYATQAREHYLKPRVPTMLDQSLIDAGY